MKKHILKALLILAVVCTAAACAEQPPVEASPDSLPATETVEPATQAPDTDTEHETESGDASTETETAPVTEEDTLPATVTETAADTLPADDPRYIQFPLTSADDTASYVSLPDMTADGPTVVEFFILPT
ncbi:MAG: hypothetical protein IJX72_03730, partial [Clostridia bacterium]|nr:hypothetical protein [Clostridia bacterium]